MPDTTTLNETERTIDGTESVRLATTGANWRKTISGIFGWFRGEAPTWTGLHTLGNALTYFGRAGGVSTVRVMKSWDGTDGDAVQITWVGTTTAYLQCAGVGAGAVRELQIGDTGYSGFTSGSSGVKLSADNVLGFTSSNWASGQVIGTIDTRMLRSSAGVFTIQGASGVPGAVLQAVKVSPKATTPITVAALDSHTAFTNEGTTAKIVFNLPTAVAGYDYEFIVQDSDGIQVVAASGDTIRINGSVSAAAGNIDSTTIGSTVRLVCINATEWIAAPATGTWVVT